MIAPALGIAIIVGALLLGYYIGVAIKKVIRALGGS